MSFATTGRCLSTTATTTNSTFYIHDDNIGLVDNRRLVKMEQDIQDLRKENVALLHHIQKLTAELKELKDDPIGLLRTKVLSFQLT